MACLISRFRFFVFCFFFVLAVVRWHNARHRLWCVSSTGLGLGLVDKAQLLPGDAGQIRAQRRLPTRL